MPTHDALRQACLTIRPTPPSTANVGSKADGKPTDGAPFLLRRLNDTTNRPEYGAEFPDGAAYISALRQNAKPFETEREARLWWAARPKFFGFKIVPKRSLPPEDEDEPEGENAGENRGENAGDIGRGPELIGSDLPRFASRVRDEREMD